MKSKNTKFGDFVSKEDVKYNSLVDEYRRIKYFLYKKKFIVENKEILVELLVSCLKHMFKVKREFKVGIEFGLNVKNTYTLYKLIEIDKQAGYIAIEWSVDNDEYLLEFNVKKRTSSKKGKIVFKQRIEREKTFFGMADYIGVIIYKKAFKSNMKAFCGYINHLIENGEVQLIKDNLSNTEKSKKTKTNTTKTK